MDIGLWTTTVQMQQTEGSRRQRRQNRANKSRVKLKIPRILQKRKRVIGSFFIIVGLGVILFPFSTSLYTYFFQQKLEKEWESQKIQWVKKNPKGNPTNTRPRRPPSSLYAKLIIPKIKLEQVVQDGATLYNDYRSTQLFRKGPSHVKDTADPGEEGVGLISGHRTTYGAPFYKLDRLTKGDEIKVETFWDTYIYKVIETRVVRPTDLSVLSEYQGKGKILILTTCTPLYSAKRRLLVIGKM